MQGAWWICGKCKKPIAKVGSETLQHHFRQHKLHCESLVCHFKYFGKGSKDG